MAHIIQLDKDFYTPRLIRRPWAMVMVRVKDKKTLEILPSIKRDGETLPNIRVAKSDTQWASLPPEIQVVSADGEQVNPSPGRKFYITVETFNPYHGLMEADPKDVW